jgi:hypothetical protein
MERQMKPTRIRISFPTAVIAILFALAGARPVSAQAPLEPAQLPSRTLFYLIWRGAPAPEVRKANSLLALWDDPDFAPVRSALATNMLNSAQEKSPNAKLTPEEIQEYASFLENAFTLGYLSEPTKRAAANAAPAKETKKPAWNGMFFVYDRTGKEALLAKAILRMRALDKEAPALSQITLGGATVLKSEGKNGATYWADHGKYVVSTSERSVMEEILARIDGKSSAGVSLAQTPAYQEAQPIAGSGVLEFFIGIPDLKNLAADSNTGGIQAGPLLDAARLDAIHTISGHLTLEGPKTHFQAAIFGDAAPGTPFDIWSAGQASPASLALVPADAVSYSSGQINFLGVYNMVKRVARAAFPQGQQGNADLIDTMAQARLGMPLPDAVGLLSGEIATMQASPTMDSAKQVFFIGIRKKPEALKLLRSLFGDQLTSERNEGDVTFVKISLGGGQGNAGVAQWNFFNLAVTPDMIFVASRTDALREVLANRMKGAAFASLATVPQFQAGRAQFPENVNSVGYFDLQKMDWQAWKERLLAETKKSPTSKSVAGAKTAPPATVPDWYAQINPQVFARHLHYTSSASWKDAKGIHWDQWLQ